MTTPRGPRLSDPRYGRSALGLALLLTLPALLPLLRAGFFASDDGLFHVYRTAALAEAWQQGVLWPRLFPEFGFGYGQAVLNFYAPLSYAPGAALSLLGVNPAAAVQVVIGLSFLLAAAAAFGYGNHLFGPAGGVLAAVVYTYAPYHLADAYLRGAIAEHAAFIFPPLILWAFTAAFWPGPRLPSFGKDGNLAWPPLLWGSLAWVGLVLTHNLTALLMIPVAGLYLLALAAWTGRWRRLLGAAGSLALAAGLAAVFWLPALVESRAVGLSLGASAGYTNHMLTAETLLRRSVAYFANSPDWLGQIYPLSWFALGLTALGTALLTARAAQRRLPRNWPPVAFHVALAAAAMFMTTAAALFIWQPLTPILGQLQYPWRFLLLEAVGLMGIAAALPALLPKARPGWVVAATALLAMLAALPGLRVEPLPVSQAGAWLPGRMWAEDAAAGQVGATWTGEFLPVTVAEQRWALGRPREGATDGPPLSPTPRVDLTRVGYGSLTARVDTANPLPLRLHQFQQPGWNARVNGQAATTYPTGELGLVTVDVPAGTSEVALRFGATPARTAGLLLSLASAVVWIALAFRRPRQRALRAAAVALGIAAVALALNGLGLGQRTWTPQPVQATLEDVAVLLAADATVLPNRLGQGTGPSDGGLAEVTLYWLALREVGQDLKAFVHVLGPDGAVIAQHDGDPVGGYTPTSRWRPGQIIADRHVISLPAGLAAGEYPLRAGMYQVDPLRNLTVDPPTPDNRVDVGTLRP